MRGTLPLAMDAAAAFARLSGTELEIVLPLRDEAWGQRHFIGCFPEGSCWT